MLRPGLNFRIVVISPRTVLKSPVARFPQAANLSEPALHECQQRVVGRVAGRDARSPQLRPMSIELTSKPWQGQRTNLKAHFGEPHR